MKLSYEILKKPIQDWPTDDNFEKGKYIIDSISVVKDGAERGVKLSKE